MKELDFYIKAIENIVFEDKQTDDDEKFGIFRVPTISGCIEFVKLYKAIHYKPHIHDKASAKFIFLTGKGTMILDDKSFPFQEGSIYEAPAGTKHGFILEEETVFLSIQSNPIQDRSTGEIDIRYE
jgi:mannose-6-phosphate isomerase-like protein (cupin superfamily)